MADTLTLTHPRWNAFVTKLGNAVIKYGCKHDHRLAEEIMTQMGDIDILDSIVFFEDHAGYRDCEILFNVVVGDA
jgi:Protein of unknown function (DUF2695)